MMIIVLDIIIGVDMIIFPITCIVISNNNGFSGMGTNNSFNRLFLIILL